MSAAGDHLDLDEIADLEEGLPDADDTPGRRAHLETCDICRDRLARLRTTRALLSALPAEQMPSDVAARVAAALPDEPPLTTIVPRGRRRRWSRHPSFAGLGAVAAGVALLAAVVIGATHRSNGGGSGGNSGAAAGAASAPQPGPTNFPVISSGTVYTDASAAGPLATLDRFARTGRLAAQSPVPEAGTRHSADSTATFGLRAAPVPAALRRLHDNRDALLACVAKLTAGGPAVRPLAVDFGRFTGGLRHLKNAPAVVVLLPGVVQGNDTAFFVGPKCTTDPSQDLYGVQTVQGSG